MRFWLVFLIEHEVLLCYTAKTDFLEQISNANLRFFIHPNFAFLSGPNKVDLRGISKLIEVK